MVLWLTLSGPISEGWGCGALLYGSEDDVGMASPVSSVTSLPPEATAAARAAAAHAAPAIAHPPPAASSSRASRAQTFSSSTPASSSTGTLPQSTPHSLPYPNAAVELPYPNAANAAALAQAAATSRTEMYRYTAAPTATTLPPRDFHSKAEAELLATREALAALKVGTMADNR